MESDYDVMFKNLERMKTMATRAAGQAHDLEQKVSMHRLHKAINSMLSILKLHYYTIEDAEQLAKMTGTCKECFNIVYDVTQ